MNSSPAAASSVTQVCRKHTNLDSGEVLATFSEMAALRAASLCKADGLSSATIQAAFISSARTFIAVRGATSLNRYSCPLVASPAPVAVSLTR